MVIDAHYDELLTFHGTDRKYHVRGLIRTVDTKGCRNCDLWLPCAERFGDGSGELHSRNNELSGHILLENGNGGNQKLTRTEYLLLPLISQLISQMPSRSSPLWCCCCRPAVRVLGHCQCDPAGAPRSLAKPVLRSKRGTSHDWGHYRFRARNRSGQSRSHTMRRPTS